MSKTTIPVSCNKDCGGGCPLLACVEHGRVTKITNNPLGGPYMYGCAKGFQMTSVLCGPAAAPSIHSGTASNHLKVIRNGDQITLDVNGTVLGTWLDGTIIGSTGVGLVSSPYSNQPHSDARFDNFWVKSLARGGAALTELKRVTVEADNSHLNVMPVDLFGWLDRDGVEQESKWRR